MLNVISVFLIAIVFSIKFTPFVNSPLKFTKCLNVVLVETSFNIFDHQACFADLRISYHSYFNNDADYKSRINSLCTCSLLTPAVKLKSVGGRVAQQGI